MADYVSREVARERLRKACKTGTIVSLIVLLAGLAYGGIAALIFTNTKLPDLVYSALYVIVPTLSDTMLATVECATRGVLFLLIGLFGLLMFRKVNKTGDAFRAGQMRQLKFVASLTVLLGFLPSVAANIAKIALGMRQGGSPMAMMSFAIDAMCIVAGIFMWSAARMLVAGAVLGRQEEEMSLVEPTTTTSPVPDFGDVPDLANVTTAVPGTYVPAEEQTMVNETLDL